MFAAYTKLQNAQKVKEFLTKKNNLHPDYLPVKAFEFIYFPMAKRMAVPSATVVMPKLSFPSRQKTINAGEILAQKLTAKQLQLLPQSQEIVGSILILEIPPELEKKEKIIAEAYLQQHKNITTVVKKMQIHSGTYRTRKVKVLAGKKSKETIHHENGVRMKINVEEMYFTSRLANERMRIAHQVKKKEAVLVMFSGAAPYPLVIAKNSPASSVVGIELNPLAHRAALDNVLLNKLETTVKVMEGDVFHLLPRIKTKFDRIVMPLPKTGEDFLGLALAKAKPGAVIHLYSFLREEDLPQEARKIKDICNQWKKPVKILRTVKCGQFSPGTLRICFDLKVK